MRTPSYSGQFHRDVKRMQKAPAVRQTPLARQEISDFPLRSPRIHFEFRSF
jgi:hypothetical protein